MEPSPKRTKSDLKTLTSDDHDSIRKMTVALEKTLRGKNQQNLELEEELKAVKAVVKRDPSYRIFVKRIAINIPLDVIKDKFSIFGRILDIEENPRAGINRSVFITFFEREAVQLALTTRPLVLNGENLKVMAWMVFGAGPNAENPGPLGGSTGGGAVGGGGGAGANRH